MVLQCLQLLWIDGSEKKNIHTYIYNRMLSSVTWFGLSLEKNDTTTINKIRHNYFTITLKNFEGGRPTQWAINTSYGWLFVIWGEEMVDIVRPCFKSLRFYIFVCFLVLLAMPITFLYVVGKRASIRKCLLAILFSNIKKWCKSFY